MNRPQIATALTIAGSDSGGGAGIQADLKTFAAFGVHGTSVITCVTAQNPRHVLSVQACTTKTVRDQLQAVFEALPPAAVKTGMLYSAGLIRAVASFLAKRRGKLVVDPVMIATSGSQLLEPTALKALCTELLPLATLITPNVPEAEALIGERIRSPEDLRAAARNLHRRFQCAVLVKGGHLRGWPEALDIFHDGREELLFSAPLVRGIRTHGTGCTYSAAITAGLAGGSSLPKAIERAKQYISSAIACSFRVARNDVLNWGMAAFDHR